MKRVRRESNFKKILKTVFISLIIVIIYEIVFKYILKKHSNIFIYNIILETVFISYIGLHFSIGLERLYSFIVNNRYKLSIILVILSTIFGFFGKNIGFKEWIFNGSIPLSLYWNIKFYALALVSYELFFLITKKQTLSIVGTIMILFSGFVQWNFSSINVLILGELIVLLINILIKQSELKLQLFLSAVITICYTLYKLCGTSLAISLEFAFIPIIIWIFIKNKEYLIENIRSIIILIVSITLGFIIYRLFISKSSFVFNEVVVKNEYGTRYLFSYLFNIFLPFKSLKDNSIYGSFISIFPFPMVISLYYIFKHEDHTEFLFPTAIFSAIGTIFCMMGFPEIIMKILGLTKISTIDMAVSVNLINVFVLFYMIENIDESLFKTKIAMRVTILLCCIAALANYPNILSSKLYISLYIAEIASTGFLFLNFDDKRYKKVLLSFLIILTVFSGFFVNKLTKTNNQEIKHYDTFAVYKLNIIDEM